MEKRGAVIGSEEQLLTEQLHAIKERVHALVDPMDEAAFNWRPGPGIWSVGQCLEHLNIFGAMAKPKIDQMAAEAKQRGLKANGTAYSWLKWLIIRSQEPPYRIKIKTLSSLTPGSNLTKDEVVTAFMDLQDWLLDRMAATSGLDRSQVSARLPNGISFPLGLWFHLLATHERRHIWQAEQIAAQMR